MQFFNRAEQTSSAHTAPKMSVGSSSKFTAKEGNLSIFSCLRSRKFTVPAGKQNNNCKDKWICFCNRSFGGRPVTVPGWRSTHSKESTTSVAKPTAFFLLFFLFSTENFTAKSSLHPLHRQGGNSSRIMGEYSGRYTRLPLKTLQQHLLANLILTLFRTREAELVVVPVE